MLSLRTLVLIPEIIAIIGTKLGNKNAFRFHCPDTPEELGVNTSPLLVASGL